ncbi:hypothetical protein ACSFA0_25325 [Variovorax sp. LT1P1]
MAKALARSTTHAACSWNFASIPQAFDNRIMKLDEATYSALLDLSEGVLMGAAYEAAVSRDLAQIEVFANLVDRRFETMKVLQKDDAVPLRPRDRSPGAAGTLLAVERQVRYSDFLPRVFASQLGADDLPVAGQSLSERELVLLRRLLGSGSEDRHNRYRWKEAIVRSAAQCVNDPFLWDLAREASVGLNGSARARPVDGIANRTLVGLALANGNFELAADGVSRLEPEAIRALFADLRADEKRAGEGDLRPILPTLGKGLYVASQRVSAVLDAFSRRIATKSADAQVNADLNSLRAQVMSHAMLYARSTGQRLPTSALFQAMGESADDRAAFVNYADRQLTGARSLVAWNRSLDDFLQLLLETHHHQIISMLPYAFKSDRRERPAGDLHTVVGCSSLSLADADAEYRFARTVEALTNLGHDLSGANKQGQSVLHTLAIEGTRSDRLAKLKVLIELGIDTTVRDRRRWPAVTHLDAQERGPWRELERAVLSRQRAMRILDDVATDSVALPR